MSVTFTPGAPLPGAPSGPLGPGNPMSPCRHLKQKTAEQQSDKKYFK